MTPLFLSLQQCQFSGLVYGSWVREKSVGNQKGGLVVLLLRLVHVLVPELRNGPCRDQIRSQRLSLRTTSATTTTTTAKDYWPTIKALPSLWAYDLLLSNGIFMAAVGETSIQGS